MKRIRVVAVALLLSSALLPQVATARPSCFQQYVRDVQDCADLSDFYHRGACGLGAARDFLDCAYRTLKG